MQLQGSWSHRLENIETAPGNYQLQTHMWRLVARPALAVRPTALGPACCRCVQLIRAPVAQTRTMASARPAARVRTPPQGSHRFSATNMQIARLVSHSGLIDLIDISGNFHKRVKVSDVLQTMDLDCQELQIVRFTNTVEGEDPLITCKVAEITRTSPRSRGGRDSGGAQRPVLTREERKKQKEKEKKAKTGSKEVPVSWGISPSDLASQKRKAIESVMSRGYTVQLVLAPKRGSGRVEFTELEVEKRHALVARCKALCEEYGTQSHKPEGDIYSRMILTYSPKKAS